MSPLCNSAVKSGNEAAITSIKHKVSAKANQGSAFENVDARWPFPFPTRGLLPSCRAKQVIQYHALELWGLGLVMGVATLE